MLGDMISMIRKEKGITKAELAKLTGINSGHLAHIEKGDRNPSHKTLYSICQALNIPYESLLYTYDKTLTIEHQKYDYIKYVPYDKVPIISNLDGYIDCPSEYSNASFAYRVLDNDMEPKIKKNSFVFVELSGLLQNNDIGLFKLDEKFIIRKLLYRKSGLVLRAENTDIPDISVSLSKNFNIIGKIYI